MRKVREEFPAAPIWHRAGAPRRSRFPTSQFERECQFEREQLSRDRYSRVDSTLPDKCQARDISVAIDRFNTISSSRAFIVRASRLVDEFRKICRIPVDCIPHRSNSRRFTNDAAASICLRVNARSLQREFPSYEEEQSRRTIGCVTSHRFL